MCWIIAGPNGAGKTTFALEYLPQIANCQNFVNADLIAAGLSPLAPGRELAAASRLFLEEISQYIRQRKDFAFETTLSGRGHLKRITSLLEDGWQVELIYLALPSAKMSLSRVAERVRHGGHDVPRDVILRRFAKSLYNLLYLYAEKTSMTRCFMNMNNLPEPVFVQSGQQRTIVDEYWFERLVKEAGK